MTRMERRRKNARKRAWRTTTLLTAFVAAIALMASFTMAGGEIEAAGTQSADFVRDENYPSTNDANLVNLNAELVKTVHRTCSFDQVEQETKEPAEKIQIHTDEEVYAIAKTVYGEALVTGSDTEMAAVAWCILNRVNEQSMSIIEVITSPNQFHGYDPSNPVDEHIEWLVRDVLDRWDSENAGEQDVGRVLPAEYLYFCGDGRHNYFTTEFLGGTKWDWSLPSPYES